MNIFRLLCIATTFSISACGGGGGSGGGSSGSSGGSNESLLNNISGKTEQQVLQIGDQLKRDAYSGFTGEASLDASSFEAMARLLLILEADIVNTTNVALSKTTDKTTYGKPDVNTQQLSAKIDIDETQSCENAGGEAIYSGYLEDDGTGAVNISYKNCVLEGIAADGEGAIFFMDASLQNAILLWDAVEFSFGSFNEILSGSVVDIGGIVTGDLTVKDPNSGEEYRTDNWTYDYWGTLLSGELFHPDYGYVSVTLQSTYPLSYVFEGDGVAKAYLEEDDPLWTLWIDANDDGQPDEMAFTSGEDLVFDQQLTTAFVPFDEINFPPEFSDLYFENWDVDARSTITAGVSGISDPENDIVTVSYQWYLNGEPIEGETSNTLPPFMGVYGDEISVSAVLNDGLNEVSTHAISLALNDAPSMLIVENLPETIVFGDAAIFSVLLDDPDVDTSETAWTVDQAPSGLTVNGSDIFWTPSEALVFSEQVYTLVLSSGDESFSADIRVVDPSKPPPLAKSSVSSPYIDNSIWPVQLDADEAIEILTTDGGSQVMAAEFVDDRFVQDKLYPYAFPQEGANYWSASVPIRQVIPIDQNLDGISEIVVATERSVYVLDDLDSPAQEIYTDSSDGIRFIGSSNLDADPALEIAILDSEGISIVDIDGELVLHLAVDSTEGPMVIGNVDEDSNLEIVLASGSVYDAETGQNEWYYPTGFGDRIAIGDVDGDGVGEIFGSLSWGDPMLFSALDKSVLWTLEQTSGVLGNICSVHAGNLDSDPEDELFVGDCQWGQVRAYDASLSGYTLLFGSDSGGHGNFGITLADLDSDDQTDLIWGSSHTIDGGELNAGIVDGDQVELFYNSDPAQLDSFSAAGKMTDSISDESQAIFIVPETNQGYAGQRILFMDESGGITISDEIDNNWLVTNLGIVLDYDKDGDQELFFNAANIRDGEFRVASLPDLSTIWTTGSSDGAVGAIAAGDINLDGFDEAVYSIDQQVFVVDLITQTLEWTSPQLDNWVQAIVVSNLDGEGRPEIVVGSGYSLSLWEYDSELNTYAQTAELELSCTRLAPTMSGEEVVCLEEGGFFDDNSTFSVFDSELNRVRQFSYDGAVTEFAIDPSSEFGDGLIVAVDQDYTTSTIERVSRVGARDWKSREFLGVVTNFGLRAYTDSEGNLELMWGSSAAMYWTK